MPLPRVLEHAEGLIALTGGGEGVRAAAWRKARLIVAEAR